MAQVDLRPLIEQLDDNIDDLEEALAPLLKTALSDSASKLPLLDRAKLYVLSTYAIESLIFSFLRLNGVHAKNHPVFAELTRVKQYFEKIKVAESGEQKRTMSLDKDAATRFIKHDLAKNNRLDANVSSASLSDKRVHTRFAMESDAKVSKSRGTTSVPPLNSKAKEVRGSIAELSRAASPSKEAVASHEKPLHDTLHSSSSSKRLREADASINSGDDPKAKKSKLKKDKKKKRARREEREAATA